MQLKDKSSAREWANSWLQAVANNLYGTGPQSCDRRFASAIKQAIHNHSYDLTHSRTEDARGQREVMIVLTLARAELRNLYGSDLLSPAARAFQAQRLALRAERNARVAAPKS